MQKLPALQAVERLSLGVFPTPLSHLSRLSALLNRPDIYIKRDDLSGLALGGNKVRKLEYLLGDAKAKLSDCVITAGAVQSNHCRQTAAAAAMLGLPCHLMLGGDEPAHTNGNLLLDKLFGSHIHWQGELRKGEGIPALVQKLSKQGLSLYVVPYGGSNALGCLGFANALVELQQQIEHTPITHIVFASSSGATHAGLMLGKALLNQRYTLLGINIDKDESGALPFAQRIVELANQAAQLVGLDRLFSSDDVNLCDDYFAEGYGVLGAAEQHAIELLARKEGILLDPVYTGRAMAGLIDLVNRGYFTTKDRVLFWHTGGSPALFAYAEQISTADKLAP
ncbi:MAG: D-cysteine desulfhydrase family protein [Paraglaciecola sp.]|nr:D-cysteine desulfhydrase family protein [Paraglaciecola sp.]NCT46835.1 D-cysteine desulfhydrase family protein [Paraglaciecola sp.]